MNIQEYTRIPCILGLYVYRKIIEFTGMHKNTVDFTRMYMNSLDFTEI